MKLWDATTRQGLLTLMGHTGQVNSVAFRPDGKRLALANADGTVKLWDALPPEAKAAPPAPWSPTAARGQEA